tara:strand:- start:188 stop:430 length:243 start_codon:yes stop_codon:yes gene_type:complete
MNNEIDTGGMAFPAHPKERLDTARGMTLRDHFAGLAMQAIISKAPYDTYVEADYIETEKLTAAGAYSYADAMIKARKNQS